MHWSYVQLPRRKVGFMDIQEALDFGVKIDYLSPVALGPQLEEVLDDPSLSQGLAVVPIEALNYMKLRARRRQDLLDVVGLISAGGDVRRVRQYLEQYAGDLVTMFDGLAEEATCVILPLSAVLRHQSPRQPELRFTVRLVHVGPASRQSDWYTSDAIATVGFVQRPHSEAVYDHHND